MGVPKSLLVAVTGLAALALPAFLGDGPVPSAPAAVPPQEREPDVARLVKSCRKCHADVHGEWQETQHAKAWKDPVFQAAIEGREDGGESCARCHAPLSILETGFGRLPRARTRDRELGVNCVTCHVKGTSDYHGPYDSKGHGGVLGEKAYREPVLCLSCHGQPEVRAEHDQGTSYLAGPEADGGRSCQSCHMSAVRRKMVTNDKIRERFLRGVVDCRIHEFTGARRGEIVKGCADLEVAFRDGEVVVTVTARTGHALPASSGRRVVLEVVQTDAEGEEVARESRGWEFPGGDQLPPGRTTDVRFPAAGGTAAARARLEQVLTKAPGRSEAVHQPIADAEARR